MFLHSAITTRLKMSTSRVTRSASRVAVASVPEAKTKKDTGSKEARNNPKKSKPLARKLQNGEAEDILHGSQNIILKEPPATPPPKKAKKITKKPPPATPTPAVINMMTGLHSTGDIDDAMPSLAPTDRPAEPHVTNAPLKTPRGSRLTAYGNGTADVSPSKTGVPRPTTTVANLLEEGCAHLVKTDPRLEPVVEKHHCRIFSAEGLSEEIDPFRSLISGIMAQQVSGAAASSIKKKFMALFSEPAKEGEEPIHLIFPTPAQVAAADLAFLRQAGLSGRKAEYVKGLAEKFTSGELSTEMLLKASYEEVLEKLIAVRGLGKWSVEMFACFGLKRMDVFSTGDLGVQ